MATQLSANNENGDPVDVPVIPPSPEERAVPRWLARGEVLGAVRRNSALALGGTIVAIVGLLAVLAPLLAPYEAEEADPLAILAAPSWSHPLGTDTNGMDILSRLMWGGRVDLLIAVTATAVAFVAGTLLGGWLGYFGGRGGRVGAVADFAMRGLDVLQAFPLFVLALALVAVAGRRAVNIIYVLLVLQIPYFARLTRAAVLQTRQESFIDAARCTGNSSMRLMLRHVLPNSLTPSLVNASVVAGGSVLLTAGLSFVGAGVQAPTPEWGYMVSVGADSLYTGQWWPALFPGAWIGLVVLGFALVGEGTRKLMSRNALAPSQAGGGRTSIASGPVG
jgi:peptide/nickel transport system permease protein